MYEKRDSFYVNFFGEQIMQELFISLRTDMVQTNMKRTSVNGVHKKHGVDFSPGLLMHI